ncbi:MAG: ATP-binding cassette domain-containing protein [Nanoarchaeota archaeon]|nr:ATP-binding cassette domain-containing protein [Nanoarchaeota archaeon]
MKINKLTIQAGHNKEGRKEGYSKIEILEGQKIGIVGPTGSGKSQLLYDIEKLAYGETKTKRKILINDKKSDKGIKVDATKKIIGFLTQHMNFMTDVTVYNFLKKHIETRNQNFTKLEIDKLINKVINDANIITGEKINESSNLLILSGGQSRALMIADLAHISESPIILIDEIENAGIKIENALNLLIKEGKIIFLATHDPILALGVDERLIMKNGGIKKIVQTSKEEKNIEKELLEINNHFLEIREQIREGHQIEELKIECRLKQK